MNASQGTDKRYFQYQWVMLSIALLVFGGFIVYSRVQEHRRIDAQERARLVEQTEIVEKNLEPQLILVNHLIESIISELPSWKAENDGFKRANRQLKTLDDVTVGIGPILVIQANGKVIASSNEKLIGLNFSQREYFQTALKNPNPTVLHVSAPFKTILDTLVISFFRTITGPNGKFAGIVIISAVPEYFLTVLDSVRYSPDMRSAIIHGDGKLFLIAPVKEGTTGMNLAIPGTLFTRHQESGKKTNVFKGIFRATGENNLMAMRTIQLTTPPMDKALVVGVGRDIEAIFEDWRKNTNIQGVLFAVISLISILGLFVTQRWRRNQLTEQEARINSDKRAEELLKYEHELYMDLVVSQPAGIYRIRIFPPDAWENDAWLSSTNAPYKIEMVSDRFCEILGVNKETYMENPAVLNDVIHPADKADFAKCNEEANARPIKFNWEGRIIVGRDIRWVRFESLPRMLANGDVLWTGVLQDITEQRQLEEKLRQSLKMESVGLLAGGVAHDFNNKLMVILGNAELLKLKFPDNPYLLDHLDGIVNAAIHSRDIAAQLLTFSRKQIVSPRSINLPSALEDTRRTLPRLIGEDIVLSFDLDVDLWNIKIDPMQLDQIIVNLAINARDSMPKGGELKIAASNDLRVYAVCSASGTTT